MKTSKKLELYQIISIKNEKQKITRADHIFREKKSWFYTDKYKIEQNHGTLEIVKIEER